MYFLFKNNEVKVDWDQSVTNYITLKDDSSSINGNGVTIKNNIIYINYSGIYELSGTLTDGKVIVSIKDEGNIKLILNNVNITSSDSSALYIENTKDTTIILKDDTVNTLIDGNKTRNEDGVIYSKDDLTFEGLGTLNITSNYLDGIVSKDTLTIKEGTFNITSVDDAIRGKDYVEISNGTFNIDAKGDGIKSTNTDDTSLGYIRIENGVFNINSENDGLDAETSITIVNGTFNIITGGGSINSSSNNSGMWKNTTTTNTISAKAIKATNITIENGTFTIDSSDDSIHSNGVLTVNNGTFNISSGDDGIHADTSIVIETGTIDISKSYEGIESANITINDGNIHIIASDDGINVAGGNDSSSMGRPGENNINTNTNQYLTINGGYIYVDATGDGLDANGSIYINGGTTIVNGPTNDGNGALDYDYECVINGGTLISAGSSGMLQSASTNSDNYTMTIVFDSNINNEIIHIEDESGNIVLTFKPSKTAKSLVFSSVLLKSGETYKIYIGGSYSTADIDGLYIDGTYSKGTLYKEVTLESKVTTVGTVANSMGGNMGRR